MFAEKYDFQLPENMRLTLSEYEGSKNYKLKPTSTENGWKNVIDDKKNYYSKIDMMIPPKPKNSDDNASALTNFMAAGKSYPFTIL